MSFDRAGYLNNFGFGDNNFGFGGCGDFFNNCCANNICQEETHTVKTHIKNKNVGNGFFNNCGFGGCFDNCGFGGCFDNCCPPCPPCPPCPCPIIKPPCVTIVPPCLEFPVCKKVKKVKKEEPCKKKCNPCYKPKCYKPCKKACDCKYCQKSFGTIYGF